MFSSAEHSHALLNNEKVSIYCPKSAIFAEAWASLICSALSWFLSTLLRRSCVSVLEHVILLQYAVISCWLLRSLHPCAPTTSSLLVAYWPCPLVLREIIYCAQCGHKPVVRRSITTSKGRRRGTSKYADYIPCTELTGLDKCLGRRRRTKLARRRLLAERLDTIVIVLSSLSSSSISFCISGDRCALFCGPFSRESHLDRLIACSAPL